MKRMTTGTTRTFHPQREIYTFFGYRLAKMTELQDQRFWQKYTIGLSVCDVISNGWWFMMVYGGWPRTV